MNAASSPREEVRVRRLGNGFTVALEPLPYLRTASFGLWVRAGSSSEDARTAGAAHFLEHLFFKGTARRSVHELMAAVEGRGGYINASTGREYTELYLRIPSHHVAAGMDILAEIARESLFCDMEKERGVILEEIASIEDSPEDLVFDLSAEAHWPDHPLGRPVAGTAASVSALTRDDIVDFYRAWYTPENMVFSVSGGFDEADVMARAERLFGDWPAATPPPFVSEPAFRAGASAAARPVSQAHLVLTFPGVSVSDPRYYTASLLANLLGGGSTSRLFERIREEEGLAYSVYASHNCYARAGVFDVYEAVARKHARRALSLACAELRRVRTEPAPAEEVATNREEIKGSMLMSLESSLSRAARAAKNLLFLGRILDVGEIMAGFDAVTPEALLEMAAETFTPDRCAFMALLPRGMKPPEVDLS